MHARHYAHMICYRTYRYSSIQNNEQIGLYFSELFQKKLIIKKIKTNIIYHYNYDK